jgi:AcrR family transcriptional regulator
VVEPEPTLDGNGPPEVADGELDSGVRGIQDPAPLLDCLTLHDFLDGRTRENCSQRVHDRAGRPVPYREERMPRDTLTRERIVTAAIELLDAEGLEGLNMRALGGRLGSAATAVYWHVGSKANLIVLAADQAWEEIALPDLAAIDWRTAATSMATDLHSMLNRHLWLVQAFGSFVVFGPGKARHDDHSLAVYEAAGFTGAQADQAAATVFTFVLGSALGPAAMDSLTRKLGREGSDPEVVIGESIEEAREIATRFPRLHARFQTAAADYAASPVRTFEFGLRAILDGLECQLVTPRAQRAPADPSGG